MQQCFLLQEIFTRLINKNGIVYIYIYLLSAESGHRFTSGVFLLISNNTRLHFALETQDCAYTAHRWVPFNPNMDNPKTGSFRSPIDGNHTHADLSCVNLPT